MAQVGDQLFDGKVVVVSVDPDGLVTQVTIDLIKDMFGNPLTLTFTPAITIEAVETLLAPLFP